jgi:hypothetical protein
MFVGMGEKNLSASPEWNIFYFIFSLMHRISFTNQKIGDSSIFVKKAAKRIILVDDQVSFFM